MPDILGAHYRQVFTRTRTMSRDMRAAKGYGTLANSLLHRARRPPYSYHENPFHGATRDIVAQMRHALVLAALEGFSLPRS